MCMVEETYIDSNSGQVMKPQEGRPSWKNRRRVILATLYFCAFCILYIMISGADTRVNETIILGCFGLSASVIGFYVAGAAWTDVSIEKIKVTGGKGNTGSMNSPREPRIIKSLSNGKGPED